MIPLIEINNFSHHFQVAAETIEKDYVISWILACLSKGALSKSFTFYGGTAIKRIYFEEHRFSEDIDLLSQQRYPLEDIIQALACLEYAKEKVNLTLNVNKDSIINSNDRIQLYVNYAGYEEIVGAPKEIRLDFSMDMQPYGNVIEGKLIESYSDLKKSNILLSVMSLNTILANKLGLLTDSTRNEPRDLFDIWFLLHRLDKFDYDFNQVRRAFKEKYGFYPSVSNLVSRIKNSNLKKSWHKRLDKQMPALPDFDQVIKEIAIKLQDLFVMDS